MKMCKDIRKEGIGKRSGSEVRNYQEGEGRYKRNVLLPNNIPRTALGNTLENELKFTGFVTTFFS